MLFRTENLYFLELLKRIRGKIQFRMCISVIEYLSGEDGSTRGSFSMAKKLVLSPKADSSRLSCFQFTPLNQIKTNGGQTEKEKSLEKCYHCC